MYEHKNKLISGFIKKYNIDSLIYYEHFENINDAIRQEKQLKKWNRKWKEELIEKNNSNWVDLYDQIIQEIPDTSGDDK